MASPPSSPSQSPSPPRMLPPPPSNPASIRTQPLPWTHQETVNLIQAYQEKWYSLKRGQLKASQWEEVAVTVTARCGYNDTQPSKTATQCRHKIEKLRRRYRSEKQRISQGGNCKWQYYELMDQLERGPLPISARPVASLVSRRYNDEEDNIYDDNEDDEEEEDEINYKSRSINYILRRPTVVNRFSGNGSLNLGHISQRETISDNYYDDGEGDVVEREIEDRLVSALAAEIKAFAERLMGMEKMKIQMMKETERCRMEMENKRIGLILESQRKVIDTITQAFGSHKKLKMDQEI